MEVISTQVIYQGGDNMIEIKMNGSVVSVQETELLYSGSADTHLCHFVFDAGWDTFRKSAVFRVGGRAVTAYIDEEGCCVLPWELLTRANIGLQIEVGVYGVSAAAEVLTTVWDSIGTVRDGSEIGNDAREPGAGIYDQIMAGIQRTDEKVTSALAGVQEALNNLPAGDTLIINDLTIGGTSAALSAEMGKVLAQRPNPNLLHNWYFANAVNQRGDIAYISTAPWAYATDRWKMTNATLAKKDGCWNFSAPDGTAGYKRITQLTEHTLKAGETYTLSMLAQINNIGPMASFRPCTNTGGAITTVTGGSGLEIRGATTAPKVFAYTFTPAADVVNAGVEILVAKVNGYYLDADIYAVKLELGSVQTLAHQDASGNWMLNEIPEYGEELQKCQRYYQLFSSADARPAALVDHRPAMRATPATGTITIDGVTLYYADANL